MLGPVTDRPYRLHALLNWNFFGIQLLDPWISRIKNARPADSTGTGLVSGLDRLILHLPEQASSVVPLSCRS